LRKRNQESATARGYVLVGSALVGATLLGFVYLFNYTAFLDVLIR